MLFILFLIMYIIIFLKYIYIYSIQFIILNTFKNNQPSDNIRKLYKLIFQRF